MPYYEEQYTVSSHDTDLNNHLRPTPQAIFMQETANHHMRDRKPTYYELFDAGKSFILIRMNIEVCAPIQRYDQIACRTWCGPAKPATQIRSFQLVRDGVVCAQANSEWAIVDLNGGGICKSKEFDFSRYETDDVLPLTIPQRFHLPKELSFAQVGTKTVTYCDVDLNRHMNNTRYYDMLWNHIPGVDQKQLTSFNVRFMAEGALGSTLNIYRAQSESPLPDGQGATETYFFYSTTPEGRVNIEATVGVKGI